MTTLEFYGLFYHGRRTGGSHGSVQTGPSRDGGNENGNVGKIKQGTLGLESHTSRAVLGHGWTHMYDKGSFYLNFQEVFGSDLPGTSQFCPTTTSSADNCPQSINVHNID